MLVFCKLGGSIITDKKRPGVARPDVISRLAGELARSLTSVPDLHVVLGHGSGSFGHVVAQHFGTRQGIYTGDGWRGFVEVAAVAARLNRIVIDHFLAASVPVWSLPPSASARCRGGDLVYLATQPVRDALAHGLVPCVYGDVALDERQGGTIVSTEQVFSYLARQLRPDRMVLVSAVDGVYSTDPERDPSAQPIASISPENWKEVHAALTGSNATDVTGGMLSKVEEMVRLVQEMPELTAHIISGERSGALESLLRSPATDAGTVIRGATALPSLESGHDTLAG